MKEVGQFELGMVINNLFVMIIAIFIIINNITIFIFVIIKKTIHHRQTWATLLNLDWEYQEDRGIGPCLLRSAKKPEDCKVIKKKVGPGDNQDNLRDSCLF